jgi:Domain of unknown function (DUF4124)
LKPSNYKYRLALLLAATLPLFVHAQALFKYTDKDGKVTYSDRQPKPGEKAVQVNVDPNANIMTSTQATRNGVPQTWRDIKERSASREGQRTVLQAEVDAAQANLDKARKALEAGRDPKDDERRIIVRKGGNAVLTNEAYAERIAKLEADVKKAEEKLEGAQGKYRSNAPQ